MSISTCAQQPETIETIAERLSQIEGVQVQDTFGGGYGLGALIRMKYGRSLEEMVAFTQKLAKAFGQFQHPSLIPIASAQDYTRFLIEWDGDDREPIIVIDIRSHQVTEAGFIFQNVLGAWNDSVCR